MTNVIDGLRARLLLPEFTAERGRIADPARIDDVQKKIAKAMEEFAL